MALPKLNVVQHTTILPFSKEKITFRPYTVEDEKILLAAEAARTTDANFYVKNIEQVIKNCLGENALLYEKLEAVDVEYLLLQLRSKSVGEVVEFKYTDESGKTEVLSLNLEAFQVDLNPEHEYDIKLTDEIGIKMRDLKFHQKIQYGTKFSEKNRTDIIFETIIDCVESIYDGDNIYVVGQDTTREEVTKFIYSISGEASRKLYSFVSTMPQLSIEVQLKDGSKKKFSSGEVDFLTL